MDNADNGYSNENTLHVSYNQSPYVEGLDWERIEDRAIVELGVLLARLLRQSLYPVVCGPIQAKNRIGNPNFLETGRVREYWIPVWTVNRVDVAIPKFSTFYLNRQLSFWERIVFVFTGYVPAKES